MSNQIKDTITVDLHNQIISDLPITDPDELEDVLINSTGIQRNKRPLTVHQKWKL